MISDIPNVVYYTLTFTTGVATFFIGSEFNTGWIIKTKIRHMTPVRRVSPGADIKMEVNLKLFQAGFKEAVQFIKRNFPALIVI